MHGMITKYYYQVIIHQLTIRDMAVKQMKAKTIGLGENMSSLDRSAVDSPSSLND
jgi:hypothetical protein